MSPAVEIQLIALRELRRGVRSVKGILLGVVTLLGAVVTSLVCVWIEGDDRARAGAGSTAAYVELKRQALEKATGDASFASYVATLPLSLLIFLKITIWLGPLLVALLGFDVIAGETQQRTVRFWTVRSRRASYYAGKLVGLWALVGLITLALDLIAGGVATARGYVTAGQLLTWGLRFWLVALVIAGAWAAIATFISSLFRTPILSLLTTFATFFVLWLFGLGGFVARMRQGLGAGGVVSKDMSVSEYLYPNAYDTMLLAPHAGRVALAHGVLLGFVLVLTAAGALVFARRDV